MMKDTYQSILVLIGAFSFAFFMGIALHEFGHAIAIRSFGVKTVKVILHPFQSSSTYWDVNNDFIGYVDAAGLLLNVIIGCSILILLWRKRSQFILPLLLTGPMSLIQEGFNSFLQLVLNIPGTDSIRIVASGVPYIIVFGTAILFISLGIILFSLQLPLYGISSEDTFHRKLTILAPGLTFYMLMILLYALVFNPSEMLRGVILTLFSGFISILIAALNKPISFIFKHDARVLQDRRAVYSSLGLCGIVILAGLMLFNP